MDRNRIDTASFWDFHFEGDLPLTRCRPFNVTLELGGIHFVSERPSSGIAGWRGGWIAHIGSEGTRPALLPAGPVPERWNVKLVFIETPDGPAINCTSLLAPFYCIMGHI